MPTSHHGPTASSSSRTVASSTRRCHLRARSHFSIRRQPDERLSRSAARRGSPGPGHHAVPARGDSLGMALVPPGVAPAASGPGLDRRGRHRDDRRLSGGDQHPPADELRVRNRSGRGHLRRDRPSSCHRDRRAGAPLRGRRRHREQDAEGSRLGRYLRAPSPEAQRPLRPADAVPRFGPLPRCTRPGRRHGGSRIRLHPDGRQNLARRRASPAGGWHRREPTELHRRVRPRPAWTGEVPEPGQGALRRTRSGTELDRRALRHLRPLRQPRLQCEHSGFCSAEQQHQPGDSLPCRAHDRHAPDRARGGGRLHRARPAPAALARHAGIDRRHQKESLPCRAGERTHRGRRRGGDRDRLGFCRLGRLRPSLEQTAHHLIGVLALPWLVVAAAILLAIVAAYLAATRPARSITRLSVIATLSGRPAPPKQVHRSALPGIVFLVIAFLLLGYSGSTGAGSGSTGTPELVLGILALIPAIILLAPVFLVGLGQLARHAPVAVRIALRDLARYRARSASALAAIGLGVMIAVLIAIFAQARYSDIWDPAGPNLASNQANIETGPPPNPSAQQVKSWSLAAPRVGEALGAQQVAALYLVGNLQNSTGSQSSNQSLTIATPQLLRVLGIRQSEIAPNADVVTSLPGFAGVSGMEFAFCEKFAPTGGTNSGNPIQSRNCTKNGGLTHPVIQYLAALPTGIHAPDMLVTEHAFHELRISSTVIGSPIGWFADAAQPFTAEQIHNAQAIAAAAGLSIETRNDEPTSTTIVNWATVFGIAIALCILAMSVGLIRSETANDLRTLAATGASSYTRRTLTAAT